MEGGEDMIRKAGTEFFRSFIMDKCERKVRQNSI